MVNSIVVSFALSLSAFAATQECTAPSEPESLLSEGVKIVAVDCATKDSKLAGQFCIEVVSASGSGVITMDRSGRATGLLKQPFYTGGSVQAQEQFGLSSKTHPFAETMKNPDAKPNILEILNLYHPKGSSQEYLTDRPKQESVLSPWIGSLKTAVSKVRAQYGCKVPALPPARPGDAQREIRPLNSGAR